MIGVEKFLQRIRNIINGHNGFSYNYLTLGTINQLIKLEELMS